MPKTTGTKPYACPYCPKHYATENSVYAHVKQRHPGLKYSRKTNKKTDDNAQIVAKLKTDLKKQCLNDEITMEQYQATIKDIDARYQTTTQGVSLDVGKLLSNDDHKVVNDYVSNYIKSKPGYHAMLNLASDGNVGVLFKQVFHRQIQVTKNNTGQHLTYLDDNALVTVPCDSELLVKLYKRFVNGLASTLLPKMLSSLDGYESESEEASIAISTSYEAQLKFNQVLESICGSEQHERIADCVNQILEHFETDLVLNRDDTSSEEST